MLVVTVTSFLYAGSLARRFFAPHPVILQIGSTVFVHGGILPKHTEYGLERMNQETRAWFLGESGKQIPAFLAGKEAIVWARDYSTGTLVLYMFWACLQQFGPLMLQLWQAQQPISERPPLHT